MLLTLRILTYRNQPVPAAIPVRFGAAGGSIGRATDNALVLDDPSKYISRIHARVLAQGAAFVLEDMGSNASVVNDRPLGKGNRVTLAHGDRVQIGDYLLQAVLDAAPAAPALAPAPVNNAALPVFEPPPPAAPVPLPAFEFAPVRQAPAADAPAFPDPLACAGILNIVPGRPGAASDPLGLDQFAPAAPPRAAESDHVSPELMAMSRAAVVPTPAAPPPFAAPPGGFAIPNDYDPLADFLPRAAPSAVPAAVPLPPIQEPAAPAPRPAPAAQFPSDSPGLASIDIAAMGGAPAAHGMPAQAPGPAAAAMPAPAAARPPPPSAQGDDAVLQALLRGLGLPGLQLQRPPAEAAELIGAVLREAVSGTISVLMARALTKKESRVEMTMLAAHANNPLKFFPNAEGALTQMLTGAMPGYMAPVEAMAGAFDDLRAHELAVIAGMRAALGAVLLRFDPAAIEARLTEPSMMDKVLSSSRKAKLWDRLVEQYAEIAREADDDLQRLFGEKFSEAYGEQVARLRQARP